MSSNKSVLFLRKGKWYEDGDSDKDHKYVGEIKNVKPNGQGTATYSDGAK